MSDKYTPKCHDAILASDLGFASAYQDSKGNEPEFTHWKLSNWTGEPGGEKEDRECLDYIFYTKKDMHVSKNLSIPFKMVSNSNILGFKYPSDHFALATEFQFLVLSKL